MSEQDVPDAKRVEDPSVISALAKADIDTQIATAKQYPRSVRNFIQEATDLACLNEQVAESCMYALPRGGKTIEGPSARLAEIVVSAWGNCAAGARIIEEGDRFVVAQGVFRDMERNTTITYEVKRRITNKSGQRFNDDMISVTSNAACSIALRNAVFKGVPKAFWQGIYDEARKAAIGDVKTLATKRAAMLEYFGKMGATEEMVFKLLGVPGVEDIDGEMLLQLKGLATALKDGDTTIEQAFADPDAKPTTPPTGRQPFGFGGRKDEGTDAPPGENQSDTNSSQIGMKDPSPEAAAAAIDKARKASQPLDGIPKARTEELLDAMDFTALVANGVTMDACEAALDAWLKKHKKHKAAREGDDGEFAIVRGMVGRVDWPAMIDEVAGAATG